MTEYLIGFASGFGLFGLTILALVQFGQLFPAMLLLYRLAAHLSAYARRGREALFLQRHIERVSRRLDQECPGVAPLAPKISWVGAADIARLRNGEVVICLAPGQEQPRNLVRASLLFLHRGVLRECRPYMPVDLSRSLDLALARDIVARQPDAQHILTADIIAPEIQASPDKQKWFGMMTRLVSKGFMTRIYLPELTRFGLRLYPATPPTDALAEEVKEFTYFVNRIARRELGEENPLQFNAENIRCAILLVAKRSKLDAVGDAYHWWRLLKDFREGADTVFIVSLTRQGTNAARAIAARAVRLGLASARTESRFLVTGENGEPEHHLVIQCATSPGLDGVSATPEEEAERVARVVIPELADDRVEIVAIARTPGKVTKIALRPRFGESDPDCLERACSPRAARSASDALEGEAVHLIPWHCRPEHFVWAALGSPRCITPDDILVDTETSYCVVTVATRDQLRLLRGENGVNVRLAEELTGFRIDATNR